VSPSGAARSWPEVSDYISHKAQSWVEALKQQAMENPMQAIAAGTATLQVPIKDFNHREHKAAKMPTRNIMAIDGIL
jgi:hypothetical protein